MKIFDLLSIPSFSYEHRDKNVFFHNNEFKARIINIRAVGRMPECKMDSYVVFVVVEGNAEIIVNGKREFIDRGKCVISEPALLSLQTRNGARILGLQINRGE